MGACHDGGPPLGRQTQVCGRLRSTRQKERERAVMGRFREIDVLDLESQVFGQPEPEGAMADGVDGAMADGVDGAMADGSEGAMADGADQAPWPKDWEGEPPEGGEPVCLELTLEDGSNLTCRVAGVFMEGEDEYIALETGEDQIQIMGLSPQGEDGIGLRLLKQQEEQDRALDAFFRLFTDAGEEPPLEDPSSEDSEGTEMEGHWREQLEGADHESSLIDQSEKSGL